MKILHTLPVLALALGSAGARSELVDLVWSGGGTHKLQRELAAGKFVELCGRLPAGATIRWAFDATGPTDFNIHYHQDRDVVYPAQRTGVASAQDALAVGVEQDYCWMWTNVSGRGLVLKATLAR